MWRRFCGHISVKLFVRRYRMMVATRLSSPRSWQFTARLLFIPSLWDKKPVLEPVHIFEATFRNRVQPARRSPSSMLPPAPGRPRKRGALHRSTLAESGGRNATPFTQKAKVFPLPTPLVYLLSASSMSSCLTAGLLGLVRAKAWMQFSTIPGIWSKPRTAAR